jgi:hypothetical protein
MFRSAFVRSTINEGGKKKARIVGQQKLTQSTFDLHSNSIKYIILLLIIRQRGIVNFNSFVENQPSASCHMGHGRMIFLVVE